MKKRDTPKVPIEETWNLRDLVDHPMQGAYFDDLTEHDLAALADDIKRNGLREKTQVIPANKAGIAPGTMLDGHQRRRALLRNGDKQAVVVVRYDLADADAATVERAFLEPNQNRRQLDPLAKARVAVRLFEIEKRRRPGDLSMFELPQARDRVGEKLGMTGRNLNRYMRVLRTPLEVQDAFRAGTLSLVTAEKVCDLDAGIRVQISV